MPIKNVCLKTWLPVPFLPQWILLVKKTWWVFPPPLPVFHFQLKLNINSNATWILAKPNPYLRPSFFLRRTWAYIYKHFGK